MSLNDIENSIKSKQEVLIQYNCMKNAILSIYELNKKLKIHIDKIDDNKYFASDSDVKESNKLIEAKDLEVAIRGVA